MLAVELERAAMTAVSAVLPMESLLDIVFMRGLTMHSSGYAMVAVNPVHVHTPFWAIQLHKTVDLC